MEAKISPVSGVMVEDSHVYMRGGFVTKKSVSVHSHDMMQTLIEKEHIFIVEFCSWCDGIEHRFTCRLTTNQFKEINIGDYIEIPNFSIELLRRDKTEPETLEP